VSQPPPVIASTSAVVVPAFVGDTAVFLEDRIDDRWVDDPVNLLFNFPSCNNRDWTHPRPMSR
jgi:hypothetical protein